MLSRRAAVALAAAGCCALASCGGTAPVRKAASTPQPFISQSYHFDPIKGVKLTIAPPPMPGELGKRIDVALATVFNDTPGCQLVGRPESIRFRMNTDHNLVVAMDKIQALTYDDDALARSPSLRDSLSEHELKSFREHMYEATLLLLPGNFNLQSTASEASGRVTFRVYDLLEGRLVMQDTVEKKVPTGGSAGEREITKELILLVQGEFAKYLLRA